MKKKILKPKVKLLLSIVIFFITMIILIISFFIYSLTPVNKKGSEVEFKISAGTTSVDIIRDLKQENLIHSKYVAMFYTKINNFSFKAGTFNLHQKMNLKDILNLISSNNSEEAKGKTITFVEGKRITYYITKVALAFEIEEEKIKVVINDKNVLNTWIDKYWFLNEDILNTKIFYPLEGYLFPDTYTFKNDASIEEIFTKILDNTERKLNTLKNDIENSKYTPHEILTLSSIIELEAGNAGDRHGIAGVFYNRLRNGWTLGSDVTTYYAVQKGFDQDLTRNELAACNPYNTRGNCVNKLPVGPIANPGINSITATVYPKEHNYFYFVADKNGKTYFNVDGDSHTKTVNELKENGLWYFYQN